MPSVPPPLTSSEAPGPGASGGERDRLRRDRLWNAPAAVVLGLMFGVLGTILVDVIGGALGSNLSHPGPAVTLVGEYVFDLAFVAAALYFCWLNGRPRPSQFGFRPVSLKLGAAAFVIAGGGYYAVSTAYATLLHLHAKDKLPSELGVNHHTAALVGTTVFVCVFAPIVEEFFFRGFFFGTLRQMRVSVGGRQLGPWVAALITAILFGLAHLGSAPAADLVPLGLLGFVLCLLRWRTGSLYPCIALHSFNNSLALGVTQNLGWNAGEIVALTVGSWVAIALITGPLARAGGPGWEHRRPI